MVRFGINAWFEAGPEVAYEPMRPVPGKEQLLVVHISAVAYGHPEQLVATWGAFLGPIDDAAQDGSIAVVSVGVEGSADDQIEPSSLDLQIESERLREVAAGITEDESQSSWEASLFRDPTLSSGPLTAQRETSGGTVAAAELVFRVTLSDPMRLPVLRVSCGREAPDEASDESLMLAEDEGMFFAWGAGPPRMEEASLGDGSDGGHDEQIVDVFYATDRENTGSDIFRECYSGERGDGLEYGVVEVNIPESHEIAEIERPFMGWRWLENPDKHIMLVGLHKLGERAFFRQLVATVAASGERQLFVFVHGFNVTFEDAALRVGQMTFDFAVLGVDAVPVLYSWPSAGSTAAYVADQEASAWSARHFAGFVEAVVERSGATLVHIIAHSMGNQVATQGLERLALTDSPARVNEYVLAAPDVDVENFKELAAEIQAVTSRMTLYAHADDKALDLSEFLRAGRPRAGDVENGKVFVVDGVQSVDASRLDAGFLDHSYFGDTRHALADIGKVMAGDHPDDRPLLDRVDGTNGGFWRFT